MKNNLILKVTQKTLEKIFSYFNTFVLTVEYNNLFLKNDIAAVICQPFGFI